MGTRVRSKNLFNFQLTGVLDDDIRNDDLRKKKKPDEHTISAMKMLTDKDDGTFLKGLRMMVEADVNASQAHPDYIKGIQACTHTELKVPTHHDGAYEVEVLVHTPKYLNKEKMKAAIIYAHGGGVVACKALDFKPYLSNLAIECGVVVFNVDYRLAPETKCPNNIMDFYEVVKYVIDNAKRNYIDPDKIAIAGESGGGYICFGTMVLMAQRSEAHLVKLAMPNIPMVSDYCFSDPAGMTEEERENALFLRRVWKNLIALDFDKQKHDPLLFPAKATAEILAKVPPTIMWSTEFDMFLTETLRLANRLRACGRLLELAILPGIKHASNFDPQFKCYKSGMDAYRLAVKEYLLT